MVRRQCLHTLLICARGLILHRKNGDRPRKSDPRSGASGRAGVDQAAAPGIREDGPPMIGDGVVRGMTRSIRRGSVSSREASEPIKPLSTHEDVRATPGNPSRAVEPGPWESRGPALQVRDRKAIGGASKEAIGSHLQAVSFQPTKDGSNTPGVRFLARSKRGTRSMPA
jgi:hypothetical protein